MSFNENFVFLAGRLGKDPDIRYTAGGTMVCNFSIAVNDYKKKPEGGYDTIVNWIDVTAWDRTAEKVVENAIKGTEILLDGKLSLNKWVDQNGGKRSKIFVTATKIQYGAGRKNGGEATGDVPGDDQSNGSPEDERLPDEQNVPEEESDELPF